MRLVSSDFKRSVEIGDSDIWFSVYSTAVIRLENKKNEIPLAIRFLKTAQCDHSIALDTARQFNLLRDEFSKIPPQKAIYNLDNISMKPPWNDNISPVVTSCANLYTTTDGKDLLFEAVSILTYAYYLNADIYAD